MLLREHALQLTLNLPQMDSWDSSEHEWGPLHPVPLYGNLLFRAVLIGSNQGAHTHNLRHMTALCVSLFWTKNLKFLQLFPGKQDFIDKRNFVDYLLQPFHFRYEKIKARRSQMTCLRSHGVTRTRFHTSSSSSLLYRSPQMAGAGTCLLTARPSEVRDLPKPQPPHL